MVSLDIEELLYKSILNLIHGTASLVDVSLADDDCLAFSRFIAIQV